MASGPPRRRSWAKIRSRARCSSLATGGGTKQHSTYRLGTVVIAYRWHPLHGQRLPVIRKRGRKGSEVIDVEIRKGLSRALPAWMADEVACTAMLLGPPQIAVSALNELRALLSYGSTPGSISESLDGERKKPSDEKIANNNMRPVHAGHPSRAKPTSRPGKKGRTAKGPGRSDARGTRRRSRRKSNPKGGRR